MSFLQVIRLIINSRSFMVDDGRVSLIVAGCGYLSSASPDLEQRTNLHSFIYSVRR